MASQVSKAPHPRRVSALRDRGGRQGSKAYAAGLRAEQAAVAERVRRPKSVAGRITEEQHEKLAIVAKVSPELSGTSAALARAIELAYEAAVAAEAVPAEAATGAESPDAGEAEEGLVQLSPAATKLLLEALAERTRAYSDLVKQVRAIGHQNNQLVKLAHQGVTYGRSAVVPEDAVRELDARLQPVLDRLVVLATQDAHVEQVVRLCQ